VCVEPISGKIDQSTNLGGGVEVLSATKLFDRRDHNSMDLNDVRTVIRTVGTVAMASGHLCGQLPK
jgi:hypothetical protein